MHLADKNASMCTEIHIALCTLVSLLQYTFQTFQRAVVTGNNFIARSHCKVNHIIRIKASR